jgi:catechol 2,3-dioxygenase-like lactoylglutathione lyase family enzyme
MNINHLHLKVASVENAAEFYERFFGLRRHVSHGDILFMRDEAGMDVALAPAVDGQSAPSWLHFGFRLTSPAEVEDLYARLVEAGVAMDEILAREEDHIWFRCLDPAGYAVEVYWEPQRATA